MTTDRPLLSIPLLAAGILAISFSALLIRWCHAPALSIAFFRLAIASVMLGGAMLTHSGRRMARQGEVGWIILSGVLLAIHFMTWIASLEYTSVAESVLFVATNPIFVAVGSSLWLRERPPAKAILGIGLALAGTVVVWTRGAEIGSNPVLGNSLALVGAAAVAGYFLIGRKAQRDWGTRPYFAHVTVVAACVVGIWNLWQGVPFSGFSPRTFMMFGLVALIPHGIGHTSLNYALKHFSATTVSVLTLTEPILAAIWAAIWLGEMVGMNTVAGGVLVIAGVYVTLGSESTSVPAPDID